MFARLSDSECLNQMAFVMLQPRGGVVADSISRMCGGCKSLQACLTTYHQKNKGILHITAEEISHTIGCYIAKSNRGFYWNVNSYTYSTFGNVGSFFCNL